MNIQQKPKVVVVHGSDAAPIVYFDGCIAWGLNNGVMQIEVAATQLVPGEIDGGPCKIRTVASGHLRCSFVAAMQLRDMLDAAIKSQITPDERPN